MMACHDCGAPGVRDLGVHGYCDAHLDALYSTFNPDRFTIPLGIGITWYPAVGWPPGWRTLRCTVCAASWVGPLGEGCGWCERVYLDMLDQHDDLAAARASQAKAAPAQPSPAAAAYIATLRREAA